MKTRLRQAGCLALVLCCLRTGAPAQQPLTLRQAIEKALKHNPDADAARAGVEEARAGRALARTAVLPQVGFTEDISRGNDPVYAFGTRLRQQRFTQADFALDALNRPAALGNFATRFSASWLAFDSFHTQKMMQSAASLENSAQASAKAVDQKVILDVVQAYQAILYAERETATAQHELATAEALLSSVNDHVKAGLAVESDRMSAQVDVANCQQAVIAAQGDVALAWAQLRVSLGAPDLQSSPLQPLEARAYPASDLDQEIATARHNRQDLAALAQQHAALSAAESASRLSFGPRVSTYGNWEDDRPAFGSSGGNNWVVGVQIGIDLLPFNKRAQLARDRAASARAEAQTTAYQQQVQLQVNQAHIQRQTAQLSLETARAATSQAEESLRILHNRYSAGLATITDLLRAEDAERQSQVNYWRAVYANAVAYAQLLFATGTLTPAAAEDLQ